MIYPNHNIPPLTQLLKQKKMNFSEFLQVLKGEDMELMKQTLKQDVTVEEIVAKACEILDNQ